MSQNKYYHDKPLTEVIEDQHTTAKSLATKCRNALRVFSERFDSDEYKELRERLLYAGIYLNEVEDETIEMRESERRIYEDANRSIEHACREVETALNKLKVAHDFMNAALDKSEIALAVSRYKEVRAPNRFTPAEENPSTE